MVKTKIIKGAMGDEYEIAVPSGAMGMKHMRILMQMQHTSKEKDEEGKPILSPADSARIESGLEKWAEQILPNLIVSDHKFEDIPGYDQLIIFHEINDMSFPEV